MLMHATTHPQPDAIRSVEALPFEPHATAVTQWLVQLNQQSFSEQGRQLYGALTAINQSAVSAPTRFALLSTLRPALLHYVEQLHRHFLDLPFPLEGKALKVARLTVQFNQALARAYNRLAQASSFTQLNTVQQIAALRAGMLAYTQLQLSCYQCYEALPPHFWQSLYALVNCAEQFNVLNAIDDNAENPSDSSVRNLLARIVLLHSVLPMHRPQWQIAKLQAFFSLSDHLLNLQRIVSGASITNAVCALELHTDQAPQPPQWGTKPPAEAWCLYVDPLLITLLEHDDHGIGTTATLVRRLRPEHSWSAQATGKTVLFVTGLLACSALLESDLSRVWRRLEIEQAAQARKLALSPRGTPLAHSVTDTAESIWGISGAEALAARQAAFAVAYCEEGQALLLCEAAHWQARIGEPLLLAAPGMPTWLGIVRHVTAIRDSDRLKISVERLPGRCSAGRARIERPEQTAREWPVILLENTKHADGGLAVNQLLLPQPLPNGSWLALQQQSRWYNQRLARLWEQQANVSVYNLVTPAPLRESAQV